ncbi:regulator of chromosome condensation [Anaeramoeba flamelloides]|uniref:Regulator of chromosome condensation n=1 Tax=Anaeramoeba flamelloides TaxID=1746091 RepID=A0AAV7YSW1_9EUKA|nr:regulator of chromosome condensation [Anaeramoeba flamelloides]|eukprot:Anaeramoba_flamelloidesa566748_532.p1 GENE.a566748_532~~a566748_532.p1  ORF type:complete len:1009 (+),score=243.18 a566748_532:3-3029(+)
MSVYLFGHNQGYLLGDSSTSGWILETRKSDMFEQHQVKMIARDYNYATVILTTDGLMYQLKSGQKNLTKIEVGTKMSSIASGSYHFLALSQNKSQVFSWCYNSSGASYYQLGNNSTTQRVVPGAVNNLTTKTVKQIACSYYSSFVLDSNGDLYAFGYNGNYDTGYPSSSSNIQNPRRVAQNVKKIFTSGFSEHTFILKNDNKLYSFGYNGYGQHGNNNTSTVTSPTIVNFFNNKMVKKATMSYNGTSVLCEDGALYTCGNTYENGYNSNIRVFQQIKAGVTFVDIAAGMYSTIAMSKTKFYAYGNQSYIQRHGSNNPIIELPYQVPMGNFQMFSGGQYMCCWLLPKTGNELKIENIYPSEILKDNTLQRRIITFKKIGNYQSEGAVQINASVMFRLKGKLYVYGSLENQVGIFEVRSNQGLKKKKVNENDMVSVPLELLETKRKKKSKRTKMKRRKGNKKNKMNDDDDQDVEEEEEEKEIYNQFLGKFQELLNLPPILKESIHSVVKICWFEDQWVYVGAYSNNESFNLYRFNCKNFKFDRKYDQQKIDSTRKNQIAIRDITNMQPQIKKKQLLFTLSNGKIFTIGVETRRTSIICHINQKIRNNLITFLPENEDILYVILENQGLAKIDNYGIVSSLNCSYQGQPIFNNLQASWFFGFGEKLIFINNYKEFWTYDINEFTWVVKPCFLPGPVNCYTISGGFCSFSTPTSIYQTMLSTASAQMTQMELENIPKKTRAGKPIRVILKVRGQNGMYLSGQGLVEVKIGIELNSKKLSQKHYIQDLKIIDDEQSEKILVQYTPSKVGEYKLNIFVDDFLVTENSITFSVKPAKPYLPAWYLEGIPNIQKDMTIDPVQINTNFQLVILVCDRFKNLIKEKAILKKLRPLCTIRYLGSTLKNNFDTDEDEFSTDEDDFLSEKEADTKQTKSNESDDDIFSDDDEEFVISKNAKYRDPARFYFALKLPKIGFYEISIVVRGRSLDFAPFFIQVLKQVASRNINEVNSFSPIEKK